jgi:hypothetical protein
MTSVELPSSAVCLPKLPPGWQLISAAMLFDGSLALVGADCDLLGEWRFDASGMMIGNPAGIAAGAGGRIWRFDGRELSEGPAFRLETPFPLVDRFSDGAWLVVASRTVGTPNARVLSNDGALILRFMLGDGIEQIAVDEADEIYVAWFDEGVAGNDEWIVSGKEWPPSSEGIGIFSRDGAYLGTPQLPNSVDDWGALNVGSSGVWICPSSDFPIIHLRDGSTPRWWKSGNDGPVALAVDGNRVVLAGGWGPEANRLVLLALDGDGAGEPARVLATGNLPLPRQQHEPWTNPAMIEFHLWERPLLLVGRGDTLSMVHDGNWLRWRVSEVAGQAT